MSHPADLEVTHGRPNPDTHERLGSVWVPKDEPHIPTSTELAEKGQLGAPLINADDFLKKLDGDAKRALAKITDPASNGDDRNFWAGVLYMSARAQHRLVFTVEPPDADKENEQ